MFHVTARGEDEDARGTLRLLEPGQHREAVQAGQIQVQDDQVGGLVERGLQSSRAIMLLARIMPVAAQRAANVPGELRFVFYDEDTHSTCDVA